MIIDKSVLEKEIDWHRCLEGDFIFCRKDVKWKIRMNDLPGELLYTLFVDGKAVFDFDEWPARWYQIE